MATAQMRPIDDVEWERMSHGSTDLEDLNRKHPSQQGFSRKQAFMFVGGLLGCLAVIIALASSYHILHPTTPGDSKSGTLLPGGDSFGVQPSTLLQETIDHAWKQQMEDFPENAASLGEKGYGGRLSGQSPQNYTTRNAQNQRLLEQLQSIDRTKLGKSDVMNIEMLTQLTQDSIDGYSFGDHLMPIGPLKGPQITLAQLVGQLEFATATDYQEFVSTLEQMPRFIEETIELMREGVRRNLTMPQVVMPAAAEQAREQAVLDPQTGPFYAPFTRQSMPTLPEGLAASALDIITNKVLPAFATLHRYLVSEYIPAARPTIGATDLPDGEEYYDYRIRVMTTTARSAQSIHEIGQEQVRRIKALMDDIVHKYDPAMTLAQYTSYLATQNSTFAASEEEFLAFIRNVAKRADAELPKLFGKLPRCPYGVLPVPAIEAPSAPAAYYMIPDAKCTRAGFYYVNTYDLHSRPLYFYQSTTLHESVPGHHFQLAIQQELPGLPSFRRFASYNAFVEGWALYAESLGHDMGFYETDFFKFGRYGDEMLRACRLVVDTGMHALHWTRAQAVQFMTDNTNMMPLDIAAEIDRYISDPGQALGYKLGEITIKELRDEVEDSEGDKFDLRAFHDHILEEGSLPLSMLRKRIDDLYGMNYDDQE